MKVNITKTNFIVLLKRENARFCSPYVLELVYLANKKQYFPIDPFEELIYQQDYVLVEVRSFNNLNLGSIGDMFHFLIQIKVLIDSQTQKFRLKKAIGHYLYYLAKTENI